MIKLLRRYKKNHSDVCFYGYGTLWEDDGKRFRPKTSDADGGFIFPGLPYLNNAKVYKLAKILEETTREYPLDLEFNLMDERSSLDGRFLSYTSDFTDHIKERGLILSGPDLRDTLNGLNYKSGPLNSAAMNLRSIRNTHLQSLIYKRDPEVLYQKTISTIKKAVKLPKKLLFARTGELELPSLEACRTFEQLTDSAVPLAWEQMHEMIRDENVERLRNFESAQYMITTAREVSERIIYDYLQTFQEHNDFEHRHHT